MSFRVNFVKPLISIVLIVSMSAAGTVCAQTAAAPLPCEDDERFAAFDFWVGEWDVHGPKGNLAGSNTITSEHGSCVLVEDYHTPSGFTGMSINYLDHATGEWVQIWSDNSGSQINIRGGMTDDGMLMVGTIHYISTGATEKFRALWTLLDDGRVRQFFEQFDKESQEWKTWFEGFYTRKSAGKG